MNLDGNEIDNVFHNYFNEICTLGLFLLQKCEEVLNLPHGTLVNNVDPKRAMMDALFNEKTPTNKWGIDAHRDNSMITILKGASDLDIYLRVEIF